ncbi:MAG: DsbE family thiol:disulfide interchange protein [Alphaproteobacteria bacterium]|nr:DsbE family thiol:disulfide interchange protein [Alphaproteobacteria bacterium]
MRLRLSTLLPVGLFAVMGVVLFVGLNRDPKVLPSTLLNQPLPAFDLPPLAPGQPNLSSEAMKGGKLTLVNVFGSWCVSCRYEHPLLMRVSKDARFNLVGIDWKDTADDANQYLATYGNPYAQIGTDQGGRTAIDLGVSGAPETFVVDKQGKVRLRVPGPLTPEIWDKQIEPLIKESGAS